ncbi:hypothetical protein H2200_012143 [Cladophialophora chaetospira]|uniref:Uncharacterized protein n=1 Tax=Cladophialophora chaetospira TaxID=386627 RepID=A0AA39CCN5_9EURO|nr:hypothetical protein H2200_012143 [Cladophialophora chaetospira]
MPLGCQITGFTPVWPGDYDLSKKLLSEALQSSNIVSAYSILTVCARRMQLVSNQRNNHSLPEAYAAKAIKALRTVVEEKRQLSERLILDISYLVLSEVYVKAPRKPEVYGKMIKDLVVMYGGLHRINPFTAQACLAWDNLMSATTLVAPSLDPFRFPELLRPPSADSRLDAAEMRMDTYLQLQHLPDRVRIMATESQSFSRVIEAVQKLPRCAQDGIRSLVAQSSAKIFKVLTAPFLFTGDPMTVMRTDEIVATADANFMHVKVQMYLTWLWQSATAYLRLEADMMDSLYPTPIPARQTSKLRIQIEEILDTLAGRSWVFQDGLLLWLATVGGLAAETDAERQAYARLMTRSADHLFIEDELGLQSLLETFPPLQRIEEGSESHLWDLICSCRLSVDWNEDLPIASVYEPSPADA